MTAEEFQELEKQVNKLKFTAGQKAGELHDLIEDRLLIDWADIPSFAEATFEACKKWSEKNQEFLMAKQQFSK